MSTFPLLLLFPTLTYYGHANTTTTTKDPRTTDLWYVSTGSRDSDQMWDLTEARFVPMPRLKIIMEEKEDGTTDATDGIYSSERAIRSLLLVLQKLLGQELVSGIFTISPVLTSVLFRMGLGSPVTYFYSTILSMTTYSKFRQLGPIAYRLFVCRSTHKRSNPSSTTSRSANSR